MGKGDFSGHLWTLGRRLWSALRPPAAPPAEDWVTELEDPQAGIVRLTGLWRAQPGIRRAVLLVHGLAGCVTSHYVVRAAAAVERWGWNCLRLNLRGADREGADFYHAGLTEDLYAALRSPELSGMDRIDIWGYSLGGHVALRLASETADLPRVRAVAAVCSPLDLAASAAAIDGRSGALYRFYLLRRLREILWAVAARNAVPISLEEASEIRHLQEWDRRVVAPRHGFADDQDYYRQMSVGPGLADLRVPVLLVLAENDPLVPAETLRPSLETAAPRLEVRWSERGGHVVFPRSLDLGISGPLGLEAQVLGWLQKTG